MQISVNNSFNTLITAHSIQFVLNEFELNELSVIFTNPSKILTALSEDINSEYSILIKLKVMKFILRSNLYLSLNLTQTINNLDELTWANFVHYYKLHPFQEVNHFEYKDSQLFAHHVLQELLKNNTSFNLSGQTFLTKITFNSLAIINDETSFYIFPFLSNKVINHSAVKGHTDNTQNFLNAISQKTLIESEDINNQLETIIDRFIKINKKQFLYVDRNQFAILEIEDYPELSDFPFYNVISSNLLASDIDKFTKNMNVYFSKKALIHLKKIDVLSIGFKLDIENHEIILKSNTNINNRSMSLDQIKLIYDNKVEFIELSENQYAYIDHSKLKSVLSKFQYQDKHYKIHRSRFHQLQSFFKHSNISFSDRLQAYKEQLGHHEKNAKSLDLSNFNGQLRPYQKLGVQWLNFLFLNKFGGILADDMGLGKTIQILAFIAQYPDKKILIITPKSLNLQWEIELAKFHKKHTVSNIQLIHYERLLANQDLYEASWDIVIFDEVHKLKNSKSQIYTAAKALKREVSIGLTGTPIENNLLEYWALYDLLLNGLLGDINSFKKFYFKPYQSYLKNTSKDQANEILEHLKNLTKPYILKRHKTDKLIIKDIPQKIETEVYCELTDKQKLQYKELINKHLLAKYEQSKSKPVLTLLLRLKQCCNHPLLLDPKIKDFQESGKIIQLARIIEEIKLKNEKLIIFTQFKDMLDILDNYIEVKHMAKSFQYHGNLSKENRESNIESFNKAIGFNCFLISIKAGGVGLNLTEANHVIHFDRWWNPAVEAQASDRVHRIGQLKNVMIYKFITKNTIEEHIDKIIEAKTDLIDDFFEDNIFKHIKIKDLEAMIKLDES